MVQGRELGFGGVTRAQRETQVDHSVLTYGATCCSYEYVLIVFSVTAVLLAGVLPPEINFALALYLLRWNCLDIRVRFIVVYNNEATVRPSRRACTSCWVHASPFGRPLRLVVAERQVYNIARHGYIR